MNINSKLVAVAAVSAITGATFLGVNAASAQTSDQSLASRIAEKFSINEGEVQSVVDEFKSERQMDRQEDRQEKHAERLQDLVDDGTLTDDQRTSLQEFGERRQDSIRELRDQNLSREEIREAMEGLRQEVEAWAEDQGVELEDIRGDHNKHHGGFKKAR